ncbi:MAG: hypothetical protein IIC60_05280 [Proteobacteria bacterium]|nr:hypothetical protein [Pseudomonadota bacterium]
MLSICSFIAGNRTYYPPANIITGLTALAFLLFSHQLVAQDPQIKRVLVLHGAWDASPWEEQFNQALMQRLQTSKIEIETSYQFLGVSSGNADTAGRAYTDYFKYLANVNTISVIVAALPIASQFLNEFGDEVLLSTPRVLVAPGFDAGREQNEDPLKRPQLRPAIPCAEDQPDNVLMPRSQVERLAAEIAGVTQIVDEPNRMICCLVFGDTHMIDRE